MINVELPLGLSLRFKERESPAKWKWRWRCEVGSALATFNCIGEVCHYWSEQICSILVVSQPNIINPKGCTELIWPRFSA
jgi:hypothetical protein